MDVQESPSTKRMRVESTTSSNEISSKSSFASKIIRKQYLDEKTADVYFICGPQRERVPGHKGILSKASPIFDKMFYGAMPEQGDIKLPDTPPEAFKDFLQFCYLDEVNLNLEHIVKVMDLTNKYCMPECLVVCGSFWAKHLTFDDICWAYHWAIFFSEPEFMEFCERKISAYAPHVFESSSFLTCDYIVLNHILQIDSLLCDESIVLGACLEWARHACERDALDPNNLSNLRSYLRDSLYNIRYSSMTLSEFREHMDAADGLFTDVQEYQDIIRLLSGCKELKTGRFNPNPRSKNIFAWDEARALKCDPSVRCSSSIFISNKPMLLGGIHCAPVSSHNHWHTCHLDMTVTEEATAKNGEKQTPRVIFERRIMLDANDETFVEFRDKNGVPSIVIRPKFKYRIQFKPAGANLPERHVYYHSRQIQLDDETLVQFPQEDDRDNRSIIKRLKFNRL